MILNMVPNKANKAFFGSSLDSSFICQQLRTIFPSLIVRTMLNSQSSDFGSLPDYATFTTGGVRCSDDYVGILRKEFTKP